MGDLDIQYKFMNCDQSGWNSFYKFASDKINEFSDLNDMISVTASCNSNGGAVM